MQLIFEKNLLKLEEDVKSMEKTLKDKGENIENHKQLQILKNKLSQEIEKTYQNLTPWDIVQVARILERPQFLDYKDLIFDDFLEIHGDRIEKDELNLIGGFATLGDQKVVILGQQRGKTVEEALKKYNRGMLSPNGYWKALRIMEIANKFNLPIITFIDTPGADPGVEAEKKGQGAAIAKNLEKMSHFSVPIINVVIGEGGSGGALGIAVGDILLMLEYAIYSVISPEGASAILFRDGNLAPKAAEILKITSKDLLSLNLIDEVIKEPLGAAHRNYQETAQNLKTSLIKHLKDLKKLSKNKLIDKRFDKIMKYGTFK